MGREKGFLRSLSLVIRSLIWFSLAPKLRLRLDDGQSFFMEIPEHFVPNPKLRLREQLREVARFNRIHAVGMGSAPAPGAVGRALATHSWRVASTHPSVSPRALVSGARARRTAAEAAALPMN